MKQELYAVTGNLVLHSRSPGMHNGAFRHLSLPYVYGRLAANSAEEALRTAREIGMAGLNVTAPFKEEVLRHAGPGEVTVERLRAANTIRIEGERLRAFNTDAYGVERSLELQGAELSGAEAVVLGAGGAAAAAIFALKSRGASVTVVNRTVDKARVLAERFEVSFAALSEPPPSVLSRARIIVSCLGAGADVIRGGVLRSGQIVLEANYSAESALMREAKRAGATVIDGREWLLHQGAKAFEIFAGMPAPLESMRAALAQADCLREPGMSVALVGFMGSGKSSVAAELSRSLQLPHVESDLEIEKRHNISIAEIFRQQGEESFREIEEEVLREVTTRSPILLSCGGGTVTRPANRALLKKRFLTVWLWASPSTILRRTANDASRPLLNTSDRELAVRSLLEGRKAWYLETSDLVVSTEGRSPSEVAGKIADEIHSAFHD